MPSLGFVVDGDHYFAGDTDLFEGMADLAPLALALLPVWGWGTALGPGHLDPVRAAEALARLCPQVAVPIHWGTVPIHWGTYFPAHLGRGGHSLLTEPPLDFARHAAQVAPDVRVAILRPGEPLAMPPRP